MKNKMAFFKRKRINRVKALKRDKWICQDCGIIQKEYSKNHMYSLDVHHIDGDSANDKLGNLITLCSSCHKKRHADNSDLCNNRDGYKPKHLRKNIVAGVRLTGLDFEYLRKVAEKEKVTISEIIRRMIKHAQKKVEKPGK